MFVAVVKQVLALSSLRAAVGLLGVTKDRLWRYSNNDARGQKKASPRKRKMAKSASRMPIAIRDCEAVERDIVTSWKAWGPEELAQLTGTRHANAPLAVEDLEESVASLLTVHLGDCGCFSGLFADILDFGCDFPTDFPASKKARWSYITVVTGKKQLIAGRITFQRGPLSKKTVEWRVSMCTQKTSSRFGLPCFSAWITEPGKLNLIRRKRVSGLHSSASAMWDAVFKAVGSDKRAHTGLEYMGLHHPQLVAILNSRCGFLTDDCPNPNELASDQRFSLLLSHR